MESEVSSNYAEVNGIRMHYYEVGKGTPVILIHGGVLDAKFAWQSFYPILSQHFRVIATDSRGHGKSDNPSKEFGYKLMCDDIAALIKELNLDRPFLVGYSDGGQIALEIGINYPELIRAIIAGGVLAEMSEHYSNCVHSWGFSGPGEFNIEKFRKAFPEFADILSEIHASVYGKEYWKELFVNISHMWLDPDGFPKERVSEISVPTLVLHGDRDEVIPLEDPLRIYRTVPNAELSIIPNADHMAASSQVDTVAPIMVDFLKRHE
ncbi:MAG: alpha/beta fold hydrolase [Promethearchaeota archaeon]